MYLDQCWSKLFELFEYLNGKDQIVVWYSVFSFWSKFSIDTFNYSFTIQTIQKLFSKPEHIRCTVFSQNLLLVSNTGLIETKRALL